MTPPPAAAASAPAIDPRPRVRPGPRHRTPLAPVRRPPRRLSGPARTAPTQGNAAARTGRGAQTAVKPHHAGLVSTLIDHPLLDRVIHGRAWIGIVAFALIGIVTMQLGLLKLNAGIGRALEHEAALQRENSALSVEDSELAAGDAIELQATHMGMQLIPAGTLQFLSAQGAGSEGDVGRAVQALKARTERTEGSSSADSSTGAGVDAGADTVAGAGPSAVAGASATSTSSSEAESSTTGQQNSGESEHTTAPVTAAPVTTGEAQG
jgi:hypothetical protein